MSDLAPLPATPTGRYRHYKGGEYEVVGVARHSETLEPLVVYRPLYNESGLWVRPHAMFFERIEFDGQLQPRFSRVEGGPASITLTPVSAADAEGLVQLRIEAMRESLERIGRFDPVRARERFLSGFDPACTRHIEMGGQRVGFVVVKSDGDTLLLDHLYVRPAFQGRGVGASVLQDVFDQARSAGCSVKVGALRGSRSNDFYRKHGFVEVGQGEFDIYYMRP